jgi:hypothetical protein
MEVHRPKPFHGWRELAKEVGIIVLGVLIALAAEQTVEWLHWRERAAQAETQMHADAAAILDAMMERQEIQACQDRRLTQMQDRLLASGPDWTPMAVFYTRGPPKGSTYAHPMHIWPDTSWRNAVASTAATHLPDQVRAHYARIFAAADRSAQDQAIEHEAASELNVLGQHIALTPDGKIAFLRIVEAERARNRLFGYEAGGVLRDFTALGFDLEKVRSAVRAHSLAYDMCVEAGLT